MYIPFHNRPCIARTALFPSSSRATHPATDVHMLLVCFNCLRQTFEMSFSLSFLPPMRVERRKLPHCHTSACCLSRSSGRAMLKIRRSFLLSTEDLVSKSKMIDAQSAYKSYLKDVLGNHQRVLIDNLKAILQQ